MNETDAVQETTSFTQTTWRQAYSLWMSGVLIVFVVCEGLLFTWGDESFACAIFGVFAGIVFMVLRFFRVRGKWTWREALTLLAIVLVLALLLLPASQSARESSRRMFCMNNMRQLGLALLGYESDYGRFPPAFVADESGRPMHSWRTLILPYIGRKDLCEAYDFKKTWNSPENQKLASESVPDVLQCPSCPGPPDQPEHRTDYVAVLGEDTIWSIDGTPRLLKDLKVDPSNVAVLIDINNSDISWHEPRDVKLADLLTDRLFWQKTALHGNLPRSFYEPQTGHHVVFADGSVRFLPDTLTPDELRRLFSITEPFDVETNKTDFAPRPIVFRHVVFYIWLATLVMQFIYIFFPVKKEPELEKSA